MIVIISLVIMYVAITVIAIKCRPRKNQLLYLAGYLMTFILPLKTPNLIEMDKSLPSFENLLLLAIGSFLIGIVIMFLVSLFNSGGSDSDGVKLN